MYEKGHERYKVNNRNGKFAFWTGGADTVAASSGNGRSAPWR